MARFIRELSTRKNVWKYVYAEQHSEQGRLHREFDLGSYTSDEHGDLLILDRKSDVPKLHRLAETFRPTIEKFWREIDVLWEPPTEPGGYWHLVGGSSKEKLYKAAVKRYPDIHFKTMVVAMSDFARWHPKLKTLRLKGEF